MPILQIEHSVRDFASWKAAFDGDPVGRERGGVRSYRILRPVDDPAYVAVDLEFETIAEAESFLVALGQLWGRAESEGLMASPRARIVEVVESAEH